MKKLIFTIFLCSLCPLVLVACNNDSAQDSQSQSPTPEQTPEQTTKQTPEPTPEPTPETTPGPANGDGESVYRRISAEDAHQMMQEADEYILLDVRREDEFVTEHIEGAILIPYDEIENRAADELPDKNALILIYCRSGRRSEIAAIELVSMGYTNVYDFGGILDWLFDTVG